MDTMAAIQKLGISEDDLKSRRNYRLFMDGVANIKEWGATGDGKTDDTQAVQAAIDAIVENACGMFLLARCFYADL
jgi:polygalacturonase